MDVTLENAPQGAAEGATRAAGNRMPISQAKGQSANLSAGQALFLCFLSR